MIKHAIAQALRRTPSGSGVTRDGSYVVLEGMEDVERSLNGLSNTLKKKALRKASRESAKVVQAYAKKYAPRRTGALVRSLKVRALRRSRRTKHVVGVQVWTGEKWFKGQQFYAAFLEFGTAERYTATRGRSKIRTAASRRRGRIRKGKFDFMRRAAFSAEPLAKQIFREQIKLAVTDLVATGKLVRRKTQRIKV